MIRLLLRGRLLYIGTLATRIDDGILVRHRQKCGDSMNSNSRSAIRKIKSIKKDL